MLNWFMKSLIKPHKCGIHGVTDHSIWIEKNGREKLKCKKCAVAWMVKSKKKNKLTLINELGGKCAVCGYGKYYGSLHFHHIDPSLKESSVAHLIAGIDRARKEAKKCVLLCANCHYEVEAGITILPDSVIGRPEPFQGS